MAFMTVTLFLLLFLALAGILLQIFLSNRENKWLGLILPAVCFLRSLFLVLNVGVFDRMSPGEIFVQVGSVFVLTNIPTVVLLGIYFGFQRKFKRRAELDKMNVQDLE